MELTKNWRDTFHHYAIKPLLKKIILSHVGVDISCMWRCCPFNILN